MCNWCKERNEACSRPEKKLSGMRHPEKRFFSIPIRKIRFDAINLSAFSTNVRFRLVLIYRSACLWTVSDLSEHNIQVMHVLSLTREKILTLLLSRQGEDREEVKADSTTSTKVI